MLTIAGQASYVVATSLVRLLVATTVACIVTGSVGAMVQLSWQVRLQWTVRLHTLTRAHSHTLALPNSARPEGRVAAAAEGPWEHVLRTAVSCTMEAWRRRRARPR